MRPLPRNRLSLLALCSCLLGNSVARPETSERLHAELVNAEKVDLQLSISPKPALNAMVLELSGKEPAAEISAAEKIRAAGLELYYWIEIARHAPTADAHPLWMASLQGHQEWRRLFPQAPKPASGEVVKAYPWVPILYREAFDSHLERVQRLLEGKPPATGIFLNDLQAAPSACGCGNILCRWTADYGPIRTATPLGSDAAAKFCAAVAELRPRTKIIPVWVTECEEHDREGPCAGVGCFRGLCWKEYAKQTMPLVKQASRVAVLLPVHDFERELPVYRQPAGWISHAIDSFPTLLPKHGGTSVAPEHLIAVVQGWDVSENQIRVQTERALASHVGGIVVSKIKIEQQWEPRIVRYQK